MEYLHKMMRKLQSKTPREAGEQLNAKIKLNLLNITLN
jgi:hypothetical protein